jgi:hypothetical protein
MNAIIMAIGTNPINRCPQEFIMAAENVKSIAEDTLAHILALRDLAINRIHRDGQWERVGETPVMSVKTRSNLFICYLTPFQRRKGSATMLSYALCVCDGETEVLSLSWKGTDPFTVGSFRPGAWEAKLEELSISASIATWWRAA